MRTVSAPHEPNRRRTRRVVSEERHQPKPMSHRCEPQNYKLLFCRLTPELSRPVAGRRTRASVAHSTWPTPRHGVGLNDLLGGPDAGEGKAVVNLPKTEAQMPERAPRTISRTCQKRQHLERQNQTKANVATEAGQRNACDVRARKMNPTEEATWR